LKLNTSSLLSVEHACGFLLSAEWQGALLHAGVFGRMAQRRRSVDQARSSTWCSLYISSQKPAKTDHQVAGQKRAEQL
jgi:hypothetical protein